MMYSTQKNLNEVLSQNTQEATEGGEFADKIRAQSRGTMS